LFVAGIPFFVPSPAIRFAERAEGVTGPKRQQSLAACRLAALCVSQLALRDRKFADSSLEGAGFELPVPRAIRVRFRDFALLALADGHRRQLQIIDSGMQPKPAIFALSRSHRTRNRKFESSSLQQTVCKPSVPL
jgi:hypothetical protein